MGIKKNALLLNAKIAESLAKDLDEGDPEGAAKARKHAAKVRERAEKMR